MDVYHNHTEQEYPPTMISSVVLAPGSVWSQTTVATWNATITGQPYANGLYKISASGSNNGLRPQWWVFDTNGTTGVGAHWKANNYNGVGAFVGGTNVIYTLDNSYYGDWVSIQLPEPIFISSCTFFARATLLNRAPVKFKIYGSNDGTSWAVLYTQASALAYTDNLASVTVPSTLSYNYFALVVSEIGASGAFSQLNFIKWKIFGKVHPHSAMCATVRIICISAYKYSHMNSDDWYIWPHILLCYT
jgi:hypothetical protein